MKSQSHKRQQTGFDAILHEVDCYGKYQKRVLVILFISSIPAAFNSLNTTFTLYVPEHHCHRADLQNTDDWFELAYPLKDKPWTHSKYSYCSQYNTTVANQTREVIGCVNGWDYYGTFKSAVNEFDIVCDRKWIKSVVTSAFFVSRMVMLMITGWASDRYGKRIVILCMLLIQCISCFMLSLSSSVWMYAVFLSLYGGGGTPTYMLANAMGTEHTGPKWRNLVYLVLYLGFHFGALFIPLLSFLTRDWRILLRCFSVGIGLIFALLCLTLPESPRWLLASGNKTKALEILQQVGKVNNKKAENLNDHLEELLVSDKMFLNEAQKSDSKIPTLKECIRSKKIMTLVLIMLGAWFFINVIYYCISLYSTSFAGDMYLNCFFTELMEVPAIVFTYFIVQKLGRPLSLSLTMIVGGVFCVIAPLVHSGDSWLSTASSILGKAFVSGSFYVVIGYTAELFPTIIKARFYNGCATFGKIGAAVSPFVMLMGDLIHPYAPFFTMGIGIIIFGIPILLVMPETSDANLPETIADVKPIKLQKRANCFRRLWSKNENESKPGKHHDDHTISYGKN